MLKPGRRRRGGQGTVERPLSTIKVPLHSIVAAAILVLALARRLSWR